MQLSISRLRAGSNRRHAPMHRIEAVRATEEVGWRLGRTAYTTHLRNVVRWYRQFEESLDDCGSHGVVATTGTKCRHATFVVAYREAERIATQSAMDNPRLDD
jgi:hypothetical protein